ncbi:hypothetical protein AX16_008873 [Volvariella volvacea WC 439]|nr:hypothetical protein AX16_008873 [Volvariella volvacea WC 439]
MSFQQGLPEATPLVVLYARILKNATQAYTQPTSAESTQELIQSGLSDLKLLQHRIVNLSLFSPNETLEDISTRNLVYLTVPYVMAELQDRVTTTKRSLRKVIIERCKNLYQSFISLLELYNIVPESEQEIYKRVVVVPGDIRSQALKREAKMKQYKHEKELRTRIDVLRKRRGQKVSDDTPSSYELIASLLPPRSSDGDPDEEEEGDSQTDEILREASLLLLRLLHAEAQGHLNSIERELEMINMMPPSPELSAVPPPEEVKKGQEQAEQDAMWRLDPPTSSRGPDGRGPLLDSQGKPLRPFTILPSNASQRARLQAQVFGPGYNLPTMSIDEYLQIEKERGNIITGGGPASENAPTSSEQLQIDSEMDGTREGEEKAEIKRLKDERWAQFTDANPRGAGNTMNRG